MEVEMNRVMQYGDNIVVYINPQSLSLITLAEGASFDNKFGKFKHEFFVGQPFGHRISSQNNKGYVYAFKLDPTFFTKTLAHRTQILYYADISLVILRLCLAKGSIVVESGEMIRDWQWIDDLQPFAGSRGFRPCVHLRIQQRASRVHQGRLREDRRQQRQVS